MLTDASRNVDGSTPVTSAGRPLYLHIWYPTTTPTTQHVVWSWNDLVYNQNPGGAVYPGLPDLPALHTGDDDAWYQTMHPLARWMTRTRRRSTRPLPPTRQTARD